MKRKQLLKRELAPLARIVMKYGLQYASGVAFVALVMQWVNRNFYDLYDVQYASQYLSISAVSIFAEVIGASLLMDYLIRKKEKNIE